MKKTDMICAKCINYRPDDGECRLNPIPEYVASDHWCSHGEWHQWSERYQVMNRVYWGDWEHTRPPESEKGQ